MQLVQRDMSITGNQGFHVPGFSRPSSLRTWSANSAMGDGSGPSRRRKRTCADAAGGLFSKSPTTSRTLLAAASICPAERTQETGKPRSSNVRSNAPRKSLEMVLLPGPS